MAKSRETRRRESSMHEARLLKKVKGGASLRLIVDQFDILIATFVIGYLA